MPGSALAPALKWQALHLPSVRSIKISWPREATMLRSGSGNSSSSCRPSESWKASSASSSASVGRRKGMRNTSQGEPLCQIFEAVQVFEDQREFARQSRALEALPEVGIGLGDEQRIVGRQRGDERRCQSEVLLGAMTRSAGAAVAAEALFEEQAFSFCNERIGRDGIDPHRLARCQRGRQHEQNGHVCTVTTPNAFSDIIGSSVASPAFRIQNAAYCARQVSPQ